MILSLAVVLVSSPFSFPAEPISVELARGEKVYYEKKGFERTFMEDRAVVGRWFDGKIKRDTDQIIWLSPRLISRWLGYLNAKEKWAKAELNRRWSVMATLLDGKMTFVAELYALPKQADFLEITESAATKPETALNVRFLVTYLTDKERDESQHIESMVRKKNFQSPLEREERQYWTYGEAEDGLGVPRLEKLIWTLDTPTDTITINSGEHDPAGLVNKGFYADYIRLTYE